MDAPFYTCSRNLGRPCECLAHDADDVSDVQEVRHLRGQSHHGFLRDKTNIVMYSSGRVGVSARLTISSAFEARQHLEARPCNLDGSRQGAVAVQSRLQARPILSGPRQTIFSVTVQGKGKSSGMSITSHPFPEQSRGVQTQIIVAVFFETHGAHRDGSR